MKVNGTDAATKVAVAKQGTLGDWINNRRKKIEDVIPLQTINSERFLQSAIREITNPKVPNLVRCTKESIERSLIEAASYGLELGGVLGQVYLIPYNESFPDGKGGKEKKMTCHFQLGYKGLIALARRSKTIKTIAAEPVYENDKFEVQLGCGRRISHTLDLSKERGEIIGYYCLVELENEGIQFSVMSKKDVEKHRDQFSKIYEKDDKDNNWNKNFDAMALKTCVIKALKLCPISIQALEAVQREEIREVEPDLRDVTPEAYEISDDTPESVEKPTVKKMIQRTNTEDLATKEEDAGIDAAFEAASGRCEQEIPEELF
jgi:recombination protein RecT